MQHKAKFDANKNILLESVKVYANKKSRTDKLLLTKNILKDLLHSKDVRDFREKFIKKYDIVAKLKCDSNAFKNNLCSHARYFAHANKVANLLNKNNFALVYTANVKTKTKKTKKAVKR